MPWNIIIGPVLICLLWGIIKGLKAKEQTPLKIDRRTGLYE